MGRLQEVPVPLGTLGVRNFVWVDSFLIEQFIYRDGRAMSTIRFLPITYYNYKGRKGRVVEAGTQKKKRREISYHTTRGEEQMRYESGDADLWGC